MSELELKHICLEWQDRLRLRDWNVEIRWAKYKEIDDDCGATVSWNDNQKHATILMRPTEFYESGVVAESVELRIIHELLHLHLWYIEDHTPMQKIAEENAVHFISSALFHLKHPEK